MKKHLFYFSIIYLLNICTVFGQEVDFNQLYLDNVRILKEAKGESNSIEEDIKGSKYINEEFSPGTFSEGAIVYSFRYNAFHDEMEVKKDNEVSAIIKNFNFPITYLGTNKVYQVFEYYLEEEELTKGFFVVLNNSKNIKLLLKETIKFHPEEDAKSGYQPAKPAAFKRFVDTYYIGYKNNSAIELPKKKDDFLDLFASSSELIEKYIKKNKLKHNKTEDLIQIFNYYNTLK